MQVSEQGFRRQEQLLVLACGLSAVSLTWMSIAFWFRYAGFDVLSIVMVSLGTLSALATFAMVRIANAQVIAQPVIVPG